MSEEPDPLDTDAVHDRESFLAFADALAADRCASVAAERASPSYPYGPDAGGWENVTIEDFLQAAIRWAVDTDVPAQPAWKTFAEFLLCGKVYE